MAHVLASTRSIDEESFLDLRRGRKTSTSSQGTRQRALSGAALRGGTRGIRKSLTLLFNSPRLANGFLLGTISTGCGADSCVQIFGGAASPLARRIVSFLVAQPYFFYRLPAIISGNVSIVLRALGRRGAWNAAKRSLQLDPTYVKGLSLMQKALADPQNEFPEEIRKGLVSTLKLKEQVVMMMTREATEHMGIMAAGFLPCPIYFSILEQSRVYKELETVMSTEAYLDREIPKSVSLSLSLVPCAGADNTTGQWLYTSLSFVDADTIDSIP
mmetsp:Transcript_29052/g.52570  ORF Transcript_29052/g.52570 Transcript_29052/m.52570 type:complete len:272 (-) Transcript_29052:556-1371(-)